MVSSSSYFHSLQGGYLGPKVPIGIDRKCLSYSSGAAPSYVPSSLFPKDSLLHQPVEKLARRPLVNVELLTGLRDDLKNHTEGRIQLFLQQMLLVYKTNIPFHFYPHADAQVGQILSPSENGPCYVGAHSGTLPTLRIGGEETRESSISFAQNTPFYYGWNTTIYLPELANQIDSAIDKSSIAANKNSSLRLQATQILNRVSKGEICPRQGLSEFLTGLINVIRAERSSPQKEERGLILDYYLSTAENYLENIDNGYPLLQKLLFRPLNQQIDDRFYAETQSEMHRELLSQLKRVKPEETSFPELPIDIDLPSLQSVIATHLPPISPTDTQKEYIKLCTLADTVRAAAARYLIFLHESSHEDQEKDLKSMNLIRSRQTIDRIPLSRSARSLYDTALQAIQGKTENPQKMHFILPSILLKVIQELRGSQPALSTPPPPIGTEAKQKLSELINQRLTAANPRRGSAAERYIKLCATQEKVRNAASLFFEELLQLPQLQEMEINKLFQIKKSKLGCSGLSPNGFAFYKEVLETIQTSEKKTPQNMPLILCRLLMNASTQ